MDDFNLEMFSYNYVDNKIKCAGGETVDSPS